MFMNRNENAPFFLKLSFKAIKLYKKYKKYNLCILYHYKYKGTTFKKCTVAIVNFKALLEGRREHLKVQLILIFVFRHAASPHICNQS